MAKISLVLVFSVVLALPFVLGQEDDWKNLLDQGGLSQDALDQAQQAIGGGTTQDAVSDYFGSALSGASSGSGSGSSSSSSYDDADEGQGTSLADFLDTDR